MGLVNQSIVSNQCSIFVEFLLVNRIAFKCLDWRPNDDWENGCGYNDTLSQHVRVKALRMDPRPVSMGPKMGRPKGWGKTPQS